MNATDKKIIERVCLPCKYRNGTQDDPTYPMSFCKEWFPTCPHVAERTVDQFSIRETENAVEIPDTGVKISKTIIDPYVNHIVDRLRGRTRRDGWEEERILWRIDELEETRRDLHLAVKRAISADPFAVNPKTIVVETLIEHYVETRAKRFAW